MNIINETRENFYKTREGLMFWLKYKFFHNHSYPQWLANRKDKLGYEHVFSNRKKIAKKGKVVLGALVQANELLFKRGVYDCPAVMIYSYDTYFEENPKELEKMANTLFALKNENLPKKILEHKEIMKFGKMLRDEDVPFYNIPLAKEITKNREVFISTIMIHRMDLPRYYIEERLYPLIVHKDVKGIMMLPHSYWS